MDLFRRLIKTLSESEDNENPRLNDARERRRSSKVVRVLGQGRKTNLCKPGGVAVSLGNIYAVSDTINHKILLFSEVGTLINQFGEPGPANSNINSPADIVFLSNGYLVVVDPEHAKIKVFDPSSGCFIRCLVPNCKFQHPTGITATVNDYVIVCDSSSGLITVINPQGYLRNRFDFSIEVGNCSKPIHSPRHVAVTRDRTIVVTDELTSSIHLFTFSGKPLNVIDSSRLRLLDEPTTILHGLCVDEDDNILIIINDAVCLLLLTGDQLWRLFGADDDLLTPRCLASNRHGELMVGDDTSKAVSILRHDIQQYRTFKQFQLAAKERRCTL